MRRLAVGLVLVLLIIGCGKDNPRLTSGDAAERPAIEDPKLPPPPPPQEVEAERRQMWQEGCTAEGLATPGACSCMYDSVTKQVGVDGVVRILNPTLDSAGKPQLARDDEAALRKALLDCYWTDVDEANRRADE